MTEADEKDAFLSDQQLAARRSNRRTLVVILIFIVVLGVIPLVAVLSGRFS